MDFQDISNFPSLGTESFVSRRYGKLKVIADVYPSEKARDGNRGEIAALTICDCGVMKVIGRPSLARGTTTSCKECRSRDVDRSLRHYTVEYRTWAQMRARCKPNAKAQDRKRYFDRGIGICQEWDSFEVFMSDMGPRPEGNYQLDRIDNDKGYSKENCRWATTEEQANNQANSSRVTFNGKTQSITQWAREIGIGPKTIHHRLKHGWPVELALTHKVSKRNRLENIL